MMSSDREHVDDQVWRTFVRQFTMVCLYISFGIPKEHRRVLFLKIPIKFRIEDFPSNSCLRKISYEKLMNLTLSELQGVVPVELMSCVEAMLTSKTPRDFEIWLDRNYSEYHTPKSSMGGV